MLSTTEFGMVLKSSAQLILTGSLRVSSSLILKTAAEANSRKARVYPSLKLGTRPNLAYRRPAIRGAGVVETASIRNIMPKPVPPLPSGRESMTMASRAGMYILHRLPTTPPMRMKCQLGANA